MCKRLDALAISFLIFSSYCSAVLVSFSINNGEDKQTAEIKARTLHELLHKHDFFFTMLVGTSEDTLFFNQTHAFENYTITSEQSNEFIQVITIHLLNMPLNIEMSLNAEEILSVSIYTYSNLNAAAMYFILSFGFQVNSVNLTPVAQNEVLGLPLSMQSLPSFIGLQSYHQISNRESERPYPRGVSNPYGNCRNRVCANPVFGAYPK